MRTASVLILVAAVALGLWAWTTGAWGEAVAWAATQQRTFQEEMAGTIRALRAGDSGALWALLLGSAGYGVVHAVGPGHGKVLLGGASLATKATARRMFALAVLSSLAQAATAILLVYGGLLIFSISARQIVGTTEQFLAPASFALIGMIGLILIWRGLKQFRPKPSHSHDHSHHGHACNHAHGPSAEAVNDLTGWRDTLALVGAIAVRPCTGALFVLAIAWGMGLYLAGALAAVAMGLGTALFTSAVAVGGVGLRGAAMAAAADHPVLRQGLPLVQVAAGCFVAAMGAILFAAAL